MQNSYESRTRNRRILLNNDSSASFSATCSPSASSPEDVVQGVDTYIDELAAAGISSTATCLFSGYHTAFPCTVPGTHDLMRAPVREQEQVSTEYRVAYQNRFRPLVEAGGDPVAVQLQRCRQHGIEYLACLRMNDRHPGGGPFKMERDDLHLSDLKEHGEYRRGFDFTHEIVRENLLAVAADILRQYDVDGLELDWMRWCRVFPMDVAPERAPLLTGFIARMRALLDEAAERRGRDRLTLSVRVPQTLQECRGLGFDVEAWLKTGALDCLCPSDFFYTDPSTRVEDFAAFTAGTACRVYPSVHPIIAQGNDVGLMSAANYRAAARNFYRRGAAGISAYNYQYHWAKLTSPHYPGPAEMWPKALNFLTQISRPEALAGPRHYLFHALWEAYPPATGVAHDDDIRLNRGEPRPSGVFRLYLAESGGTLVFKAIGLAQNEVLAIAVNGAPVPAQSITTAPHPQGQSEKQGHPRDAFVRHRIALSAPPLQEGDNELQLELTGARQDTGTVEIREVEVICG